MAQPGHVHRRDRRRLHHRPVDRRAQSFAWLITAWLWLTVLFANLAEAVAEGRGKAQPRRRGDAPADPVVPADAVTASGSGLDPDISVKYADPQAARVARERGVTLDRVRELIKQNTGHGVVNVLKLNMALDGGR